MLWGAIGGVIPDLDTLANFVTDEISALAFHRAFMHSFLFPVLAAPVLGWLVHRLYGGTRGPLGQKVPYWGLLLIGLLWLFAWLWVGSALMPVPIRGVPAIAAVTAVGTLLLVGLLYMRERLRRQPPANTLNAGWGWWALLFFCAIITHPLLDACTVYGTQLMEPFQSTRYALNTISVIDPLFSGPLFLCLLVASRFRRRSPGRRYFSRLGFVLSGLYLALTLINHESVRGVLDHSMRIDGIDATRRLVSPTLGNNILWQGTAETDSAFFYGKFSFFDPVSEFQLQQLPKNHELLQAHWEDRDVAVLRWFSNGYFNAIRRPDGRIQINDLRYGWLTDTLDQPSDFLFHWVLEEQSGELSVVGGSSLAEHNFQEMLNYLRHRVPGN